MAMSHKYRFIGTQSRHRTLYECLSERGMNQTDLGPRLRREKRLPVSAARERPGNIYPRMATSSSPFGLEFYTTDHETCVHESLAEKKKLVFKGGSSWGKKGIECVSSGSLFCLFSGVPAGFWSSVYSLTGISTGFFHELEFGRYRKCVT